jgi:uncharacterized membrane protein
MVDVSSEILIRRPRETVSAFAANPENAPAWYVNIESAEWRSEPVLEKGSRVAFRARFLGRTLDYVYEITDFVPGERMTMRTAEGPFPMETTYEWFDGTAGETRMSLRNRGMPSGFASVLVPMMRWAMRRANRADLRRLKQILEGSRREAPS